MVSGPNLAPNRHLFQLRAPLRLCTLSRHLFIQASRALRSPLALPSCLSALSATCSIRTIHPEARLAPSQCHLQQPRQLRLRALTAPGAPATTDPPARRGQRPTTTSTGLHRRSRMIGRITVSSEMGGGTTSTTSCCRMA